MFSKRKENKFMENKDVSRFEVDIRMDRETKTVLIVACFLAGMITLLLGLIGSESKERKTYIKSGYVWCDMHNIGKKEWVPGNVYERLSNIPTKEVKQ